MVGSAARMRPSSVMRVAVEGDVQVDAHQHAAVADPLVEQVVEGLHSFEATRPVMSTSRLE